MLEAVPPDPVLRFSHPLLREAAEAMLPGPARRRLHRVIAAALEDPDEAAWHLARGADEPDEALAGRVERAVQNAAARGAAARAAALARSAVELTPDPDGPDGWRRRIVWLERLDAEGEFDQVRRLGEKWALDVPVSWRGRLTAMRAEVEADVERGCGLLAEAIEDLAGQDPARAAQAGAELGHRIAFLLGRLDQGRVHAAAAVTLARAAGNPVILRGALAADAYLAALAGEADVGDRLREAVRLPGFIDTPIPYVAPEMKLALWYLWRGEADRARDLLNAVITVAERHGSDENIHGARLHLAEVEWRAGNWDAAAAHAAAVARWSRESGYGQQWATAYVVSLIEAGRGNIGHARELAAHGQPGRPKPSGTATYAAQCRWVLGQLELSADDPAAALRWLEPIADMLQASGIGEPGCYPFTPDLIEAWAATGQLDRAASRLAWLQDAARRLDHPWARITSGRAQAALLLARRDPAAAAAAVAAVVPEARQRRLPFELGRCLLVLGTAQRKARQRRDAAAIPRRGHRHLRRPGRAAVAGAGRGAAGPARARTRPRPDRDRAAHRRPGGRRADQPGDRRGLVHQRQDRRGQPHPHLPQARPPRASRPGAPQPRLGGPRVLSPGAGSGHSRDRAPGQTQADVYPGRLQRRDPSGRGDSPMPAHGRAAQPGRRQGWPPGTVETTRRAASGKLGGVHNG